MIESVITTTIFTHTNSYNVIKLKSILCLTGCAGHFSYKNNRPMTQAEAHIMGLMYVSV